MYGNGVFLKYDVINFLICNCLKNFTFLFYCTDNQKFFLYFVRWNFTFTLQWKQNNEKRNACKWSDKFQFSSSPLQHCVVYIYTKQIHFWIYYSFVQFVCIRIFISCYFYDCCNCYNWFYSDTCCTYSHAFKKLFND